LIAAVAALPRRDWGFGIRDLPPVELPTRCDATALSSWLERFIDLSSSIPNP
jgi:hypothetical protein